MFFRQFLHEDKSCLSYMVGCPAKGVVIIIDPQMDIDLYINTAQKYNLKITDIFETHVQADHLSGASKLSQKTGAKVYLHQSAHVKFDHEKLVDKQVLNIGDRTVSIVHTPGHTEDSICLLINNWFLLTGDTLFVGDVGRVDLSIKNNPTEIKEKAAKLYHGLFERLLKFPPETEIFPGHFGGSVCGKSIDGKPISTIGYEKKHNYALQFQSQQQFIEFITKNVPLLPENFRKIKLKNAEIT